MADETSNCGCGPETIIVYTGAAGVPGPQGPPGPAGPGVTFPIEASNISVTNAGYANLQEVIDYLLYIPLTINSFSTAVVNYLIGTSVSSLTFNWSLSKAIVPGISGTISGVNLAPVTITTSPTVGILSAPLNPGVVGTSYAYQLAVTDSTLSPVANTSINFYNNVYFGDSTIPGILNSSFVTSLSSAIQPGRSRTINSLATGLTTYAWYAHRSALGTATFSVGGFPGGFNSAVVVSVTNSAGFTENYNVYRSTNPAIGPVTIDVS